jgi:hypothetical protein
MRIVDGAEWIWNRTTMSVRRCEMLDVWHAWSRTQQADHWAHQIAEHPRAVKVAEVITPLKRMHPKTPELCDCRPHRQGEHAGREHCDEYPRLSHEIGSGTVARRLLALPLLLLSDN